MARKSQDSLVPLGASRNVRLFRNGRNQAVRIPREFELPGDEAVLWKEGDRLIIRSAHRPRLLDVVAGFDRLDVEFPDVDAGLMRADDVEI